MPSTTREVNLYCKNGYLLQISSKGEMSGTHHVKDNEFGVINVSTVDHGVVTLQAAAAGMYVAINNMGKVQTKNKFTEDCLFYEELNPASGYISYRSYQSSKRKYYLGISRRGKIRPANKILPDQNCAKFLHLNACDVPEEKKTVGQIEQEKIEKVLASHILMQEVSRKVGLTKSQKQEARTEELTKKKLEQPVVPETTIPSERKRKKKKKPVKEALGAGGQESDGKPDEKTKQKEVNQAKKRTSQSTDKDKEGKIDSNDQMAKKHRPSGTKEITENIQKQVENKNTESKPQQKTKEKEQMQKEQTKASSKESDGVIKQQQAGDGGKHEVSAAQIQRGNEDEKQKTHTQDNKLSTKEDYTAASGNVLNEACTSYVTEQVDESVQKNYGKSEINNKSEKNDAIPVKKQDHIPSSGDHNMKQQETAAISYQSEMPKKQEKGNFADKVGIKDQIEKEVGMKETDFQTIGDQPPESISQSTCKNNQSQQVTQNEKGAVTKVPNTLQEINLSAPSETADVDKTRSDVKKKEKKSPNNDNKTEKKERLKTEKKDKTKKKDTNIDKQETKSGESGHHGTFEKNQKTGQTDNAATEELDPSGKKQEPLGKKPEATAKKQEASEKEHEALVKKQKLSGKKQDAPKKKQESLEKKTDAAGKKHDASGRKIEPVENKQKAAEKKSETSKSKQKSPEKKQESPRIKQEAQTPSSTKQNKQGQSGKKQNKQELSAHKPDKQEESDETQDKQELIGTKQDPLHKQEKSEPSNMKQKEQQSSENKQEPSKKKQKKQQPLNKNEEKQQPSDKKKQDNQEPLENKQAHLTTLPVQQELSEMNEPPGKKQNKGNSKDREPKHHKDVGAGESEETSQKGICQTETKQSTSESPNTGNATKEEQHTKKNKKKNKQKTNNRQKADANETLTANKSAKLEDENPPKQDSMIKTDQAEPQNTSTAVSAASAPEQHTAVTPISVPEQTTIVRDPFNVSTCEIDVINQPLASADHLEPMAEENEAVLSEKDIEPDESQQEHVHEVNNNQVVDVANNLHSSQQVQELTPSSIEHAYNEISTSEETQSLTNESQMSGACLDTHQKSPLAQSQLDPIGKNIPTSTPMWSDIAQQQPSYIDQQQGFMEQTVTSDATNTSQDAAGQISMDPRPTENDSILSWSDIVQQSPPSVVKVAEEHTINKQTSNNDIVQSCEGAPTHSNLPTDQPKLESDIPQLDVQENNSSPPVELHIGQVAGEITQNEPPTWSDIVQHSPQQDVQEQNTRANNIQSIQQVPDQAFSPIELNTDLEKSASLNKSMPTNSVECEEGNTESALHELTVEASQEPIQVTDKDKNQVENVPTFSDILQKQSLQQPVSKQVQGTEGCHGTQSLLSVSESKPDIWEEFSKDSEETPVERESDTWEEFMRSPSDQQEPDPLVPDQTEPDIWEEFMRDPEEDTQDTNNNTAEDGDFQLVGQPGRSQITKERVQSSNEPQQYHFEAIESKVAQPSVQQTEVLAKPLSQTHPQVKVPDGSTTVPSLQPQTLNLTPSIPPKTVLPDPSLVTANPLSQTPTPMDAETSAMPYDHPWSADFNQQPVNAPLAPAPNIWEEYMGAAGGATDIVPDQSDVWDKYMMPGGLMGSSPDAGTMQFAHAFFKDDISHDQQQLEQAYHQQITSQHNQQPGNTSSFGHSVDSSQRQKQLQAGQSLRSEEQLAQATTQPQLMQELGDSLGQPLLSQHQGQAVVHNVGTNNNKQPDLVAGMGQMAPMDNAQLSFADPWVMRQDVPVASPTTTNTQVNVGTPVDEAFEASGLDELHID